MTLAPCHRDLAGLNRGVSAEVVRGENKVLLKGTVEHVEQAKAWLQELLAEAEGCAVQLSINGAQWDKLMRPLGRERIELYRKLQDAHGCVGWHSARGGFCSRCPWWVAAKFPPGRTGSRC